METDFKTLRARLVAGVSLEIKDRRVLQALARVPRELFVPESVRRQAYEDRPLPIGLGQTISQPFIVGLMTQALGLNGGEKVLEVGTGSGYQAAVLAELAGNVVTVERLPDLSEKARHLLGSLGYRHIEFQAAEETLGWQRGAPYDAIVVTAAAPRVPDELVAQLAAGGRLVIPVGSRYLQELCRITRLPNRTAVEELGACRFVSLIGKNAWTGQEV